MAEVTTTDDISKQLTEIQERKEERLKKIGDDNVQIAFAREVKGSLLFKYDWSQLLCSAPLSLSLIASCYVATNSDAAQSIDLMDVAPEGGFQHIRYKDFKAALIQVCDTGCSAFIVAQKNMELVKNTCGQINTHMQRVNEYLASLPDPGAKVFLIKSLDSLKSCSDDCLNYTQTIEQEFIKWLALVCELHQVTQAKEDQTEKQKAANLAKIVEKQTQQDLGAQQLEKANERAQDMKRHMDETLDLFKEASKEKLGPWEALGYSIASNLATTTTTLISQGLPAMMATRYPAAFMMSGGFGHPGEPAQPSQDVAAPTTLPGDGQDPSLVSAPVLSGLFTPLVTLLGDSGKDVDWETVSSVDPSGQSHLDSIRVPIRWHLDHIQWTNQAPSVEIKNGVQSALDVIEKLQSEADKRKKLATKWEKPSQETVQVWREKMTSAKAKVTAQATVAACLPGAAGGTISLGVKPPPASVQSNPNAGLAAMAQAKEQLKITQAAYITSKTNHAEAIAYANKIDSELTNLKSSLALLKAENITLEQIKSILRQCIGALIEIKSHITNLVGFFTALSAMVEHVVKHKVTDFVEQAETARDLILGGVNMLDFARQTLFNTSLMCQAYFSLFATIADMYLTVSTKHIIPGLELCDKLSVSVKDNKSHPGEQVQALNKFSDNAQKEIKALVSKAQAEVSQTLEDRVKMIAKEVQMLPPSKSEADSTEKAITDGQQVVTSAAANGFRNHSAPAMVLSEKYASVSPANL